LKREKGDVETNDTREQKVIQRDLEKQSVYRSHPFEPLFYRREKMLKYKSFRTAEALCSFVNTRKRTVVSVSGWASDGTGGFDLFYTEV
jgi:hypothetical protein